MSYWWYILVINLLIYEGIRLRKGSVVPARLHNKHVIKFIFHFYFHTHTHTLIWLMAFQEINLFFEYWWTQEVVVVENGGVVVVEDVKSLKGNKRKRKLSKSSSSHLHHWLPRFHEDYYGPRIHRPKHH